MTRVLLIQEHGQPVPPTDGEPTISAADLPVDGAGSGGARDTLEAVRTGRADAIVLALPAGCGATEPAAAIKPLLDAAPVPTVLCFPYNLHALPRPSDQQALAGLVTDATAVIYGFGPATVELAIQAAVQLVRQRPEA